MRPRVSPCTTTYDTDSGVAVGVAVTTMITGEGAEGAGAPVAVVAQAAKRKAAGTSRQDLSFTFSALSRPNVFRDRARRQ